MTGYELEQIKGFYSSIYLVPENNAYLPVYYLNEKPSNMLKPTPEELDNAVMQNVSGRWEIPDESIFGKSDTLPETNWYVFLKTGKDNSWIGANYLLPYGEFTLRSGEVLAEEDILEIANVAEKAYLIPENRIELDIYYLKDYPKAPFSPTKQELESAVKQTITTDMLELPGKEIFEENYPETVEKWDIFLITAKDNSKVSGSMPMGEYYAGETVEKAYFLELYLDSSSTRTVEIYAAPSNKKEINLEVYYLKDVPANANIPTETELSAGVKVDINNGSWTLPDETIFGDDYSGKIENWAIYGEQFISLEYPSVWTSLDYANFSAQENLDENLKNWFALGYSRFYVIPDPLKYGSIDVHYLKKCPSDRFAPTEQELNAGVIKPLSVSSGVADKNIFGERHTGEIERWSFFLKDTSGKWKAYRNVLYDAGAEMGRYDIADLLSTYKHCKVYAYPSSDSPPLPIYYVMKKPADKYAPTKAELETAIKGFMYDTYTVPNEEIFGEEYGTDVSEWRMFTLSPDLDINFDGVWSTISYYSINSGTIFIPDGYNSTEKMRAANMAIYMYPNQEEKSGNDISVYYLDEIPRSQYNPSEEELVSAVELSSANGKFQVQDESVFDDENLDYKVVEWNIFYKRSIEIPVRSIPGYNFNTPAQWNKLKESAEPGNVVYLEDSIFSEENPYFNIEQVVAYYLSPARKAYRVAYNANGGTGVLPDNAFYQKGTNAVLAPDDTLVRDGYTFEGWKITSKDGSLSKTQEGESGFRMPESSVEITAQWKKIEKYSVVYYGNGNTGGLAPTDYKQYSPGESAVILGQESLLKKDYSFSGWNTKADGSGKTFNQGEEILVKAKVDLYAQWKADKTPEKPDKPVEPEKPDKPVNPDKPIKPDKPVKPEQPSRPEKPTANKPDKSGRIPQDKSTNINNMPEKHQLKQENLNLEEPYESHNPLTGGLAGLYGADKTNNKGNIAAATIGLLALLAVAHIYKRKQKM